METNTKRGELVLTLNGSDRKLRFSLNSMAIWCELKGKELGREVELHEIETFTKELGNSPAKAIRMYGEMVYSAMVNECNYSGITVDFTLEQVKAWMADLGLDVYKQVATALGASMQAVVPKNAGPQAAKKKEKVLN